MVVGRTPTGVRRYFNLLDEGYEYKADYEDVFARTYVPDPGFGVEARAWALVHYMLSTEERPLKARPEPDRASLQATISA